MTWQEHKGCNIIVDGRLNNLLVNDIERHANIRKLATRPGDNCMNGFVLNHLRFEKNCNLIVIDLSELQIFDS